MDVGECHLTKSTTDQTLREEEEEQKVEIEKPMAETETAPTLKEKQIPKQTDTFKKPKVSQTKKPEVTGGNANIVKPVVKPPAQVQQKPPEGRLKPPQVLQTKTAMKRSHEMDNLNEVTTAAIPRSPEMADIKSVAAEERAKQNSTEEIQNIEPTGSSTAPKPEATTEAEVTDKEVSTSVVNGNVEENKLVNGESKSEQQGAAKDQPNPDVVTAVAQPEPQPIQKPETPVAVSNSVSKDEPQQKSNKEVLKQDSQPVTAATKSPAKTSTTVVTSSSQPKKVVKQEQKTQPLIRKDSYTKEPSSKPSISSSSSIVDNVKPTATVAGVPQQHSSSPSTTATTKQQTASHSKTKPTGTAKPHVQTGLSSTRSGVNEKKQHT